MNTQLFKGCLIALSIVTCSSASALFVDIDANVLPLATLYGPPLPGFVDVPGQTMSILNDTVGDTVVDCTVLTGACTQSLGSASLTTGSGNLPAPFVASFAGSVGDDLLQLSGSVSCASGCDINDGPNVSPAAGIRGVDYQQLMVLSGTSIPTSVLLDITYSIVTSYNYASPANAGFLANVLGAVEVLVPQPTFGFQQVFEPFRAGVTSGEGGTGPQPIRPGESVVGDTETFSVFTDTPYWLALRGVAGVGFILDGQNYDGLDVNFSVSVDPTLSVNAAWAAANPDLAAGLSINRQFTSAPITTPVPEPDTAVLLVAGGLGMLLIRRRLIRH